VYNAKGYFNCVTRV